MKIHCIVGLYIIFIAALVIGFKSGSTISNPEDELANAYSTSMDSSPGYQHNILLIQVDQIEGYKPHLKSVWLMAFYTNSPRVDLLPIYPVNKPGAREQIRNLPARFDLTSNGEPGEAFWLEMEGINTWWNGYFMMDEIAPQMLLERPTNSSSSESAISVDDINSPGSHQDETGVQVELYRELCQEFSKNPGTKGFYDLFTSLKSHTRSNLKLSQYHDIWRLLRFYGSNLECNFPSLQAAIP